jgi:hypothetical protein
MPVVLAESARKISPVSSTLRNTGLLPSTTCRKTYDKNQCQIGPRGESFWTVRGRSAVGVFTAQAAVVEHDISTVDIIPKTPPAKGKPVLAFSLSDTFQFSDAMLTIPVVRVGAENSQSICIGYSKLSVASGKGAEESVKARSGADRKRRRHAF